MRRATSVEAGSSVSAEAGRSPQRSAMMASRRAMLRPAASLECVLGSPPAPGRRGLAPPQGRRGPGASDGRRGRRSGSAQVPSGRDTARRPRRSAPACSPPASCSPRRHEVEVARVAGGDDRLAQRHRLGQREAEALGAVQRDVAVAGGEQRVLLRAGQGAVDHVHVGALGGRGQQLPRGPVGVALAGRCT